MVERELQDSGWFTYWNFPSYELFSSKESILRFSFNILTYKSWRFELLQFLNHSRYTFFPWKKKQVQYVHCWFVACGFRASRCWAPPAVVQLSRMPSAFTEWTRLFIASTWSRNVIWLLNFLSVQILILNQKCFGFFFHVTSKLI